MQFNLLHFFQNLPIQPQVREDPIWKWSQNGEFSVKTAYFALKNIPGIRTRINRIWALRVPPRFRVFGWLATLNRILTLDNLMKRGICIVNRCIMCKQDVESVTHLFVTCTLVQTLHDRVAIQLQTAWPNFKELTGTQHTLRENSISLITHFITWREVSKDFQRRR